MRRLDPLQPDSPVRLVLQVEEVEVHLSQQHEVLLVEVEYEVLESGPPPRPTGLSFFVPNSGHSFTGGVNDPVKTPDSTSDYRHFRLSDGTDVRGPISRVVGRTRSDTDEDTRTRAAAFPLPPVTLCRVSERSPSSGVPCPNP